MRNILVTVILLAVVAGLLNATILGTGNMKTTINGKGTSANTEVGALAP